MQPLGQLLDRITWDADFGRGRFALGYYDRVAGKERVVPFDEVKRDRDRQTLTLLDDTGMAVHIPLHRVRTVYRDGIVIWERPRAAKD
jgi:uncharacterized protein (UPF0248 family)